MTINEVRDEIKQARKTKKPAIIGIEGYGGSGKTTFANKLSEELGNAYIVNIDDFIVKEKINETSWDKGGFDRARLESQVLLPASKGQEIRYQKLLWKNNTLSMPKVISKNIDYLIV